MSTRIEFEAESVEVKPNYSNSVTVEVEIRNIDDILDDILITDIVKNCRDELLDEIGVAYIKEYFGLTEAE
jgi:hypothetical protein